MPGDQLGDLPTDNQDVLVPKPIDDPDPLLPGAYEPGPPEHLQVSGDRGLAHGEHRLEVTAAQIAAGQELDEPQANRVGQGAQNLGFPIP